MQNNQLYPISQKEGLFVVSVPKEAAFLKTHHTYPDKAIIDYWYGKDRTYIGVINLPSRGFEIIGTYSPKAGFSFDPALIVEGETVEDNKGSDTYYLNYIGNNFVYKTAEGSVISLLYVNEIYFENLLVKNFEYKLPGETDSDYLLLGITQWQEAQSKVVEKILFIQKIK